MATIPGILTPYRLTLYFDGQSHTVEKTDPYYPGVLQAYKDGDVEAAKRILCKPAAIAEVATATSDAKFDVRGGVIHIDDEPVHGTLNTRLVEFMREGLPFQPLVAFVRKIRRNPSFRAVNSLYGFLEANEHPLLENGNFLAYKRVRQPDSQGRMLDIHSGTMDNRPGSEPRMPRNQVNEDQNQTCSFGLHVANWDYAMNRFGSQGDAMLEVEVDPADVVAIPHDYNESKMRTCGYKVIRVVTNPNPSRTLARYDAPVSSEEEEEEIEEEDEEEEDCPGCAGCSADEEEEDPEEEEEEECCDHCGAVTTGYGDCNDPECPGSEEYEEEGDEDSYVPSRDHDEVDPLFGDLGQETLDLRRHLVIDENQQNLRDPSYRTVATTSTGTVNADPNPTKLANEVTEVLSGLALMRVIPTDSLKSLLQTLLVSNDPTNAVKITQIVTVLGERGCV